MSPPVPPNTAAEAPSTQHRQPLGPRIIDISPPITQRIAVFPGDTPFSQDWLLRQDRGDNIDLSTIHTTVHLGAHTDGPSHYSPGASGIGERPLSRYLGAVEVVAVDLPRRSRILPRHLPATICAPRVLFKTGSFPDPNHWSDDFVSLSPEVVHFLADRGCVLVGVDTPSIDPATDASLLSHAAIAARDLAVLEGVVLGHVPPGIYTLIALPLNLPGADASPVRAVLLADGGTTETLTP